MTVYTDEFQPYDPPDDGDAFDREYVVQRREVLDGDEHVSIYESHASLTRQWLSPHQDTSKDRLTSYLRAFQL